MFTSSLPQSCRTVISHVVQCRGIPVQSRFLHKASPRSSASVTSDRGPGGYTQGLEPLEPVGRLGNLDKHSASRPVSLKPSSDKGPEFHFPRGTTFRIPSRQIALDNPEPFARSLAQHGVIAVQLGFDDPQSQFMVDLVEAMGGIPDTHSGRRGALWDITYRPCGVVGGETGQRVVSRSHSLGEFVWHTDGSFESNPPRYFGLHIIHPDKMGGGIFRALRVAELVRLLSPASVEALLQHEFEIQVPPEFYKGAISNRNKLLLIEPETGNYLLRFREDILKDPPSDSPAANAAVAELKAVLARSDGVGQRFSNEVFRENAILLMDNARFLHCRTEIKDPRRLLRRVRFNAPALQTFSSYS